MSQSEVKKGKDSDWNEWVMHPELIPEELNIVSYLLDRHLEEGRGSKIAVYYQDTKLTYAELAALSNRAGNALRQLGVERENRVMICLRDCPELLASYFGALKLGAIPVPVNTMFPVEDYIYYLNDSRSKALVIESDIWQRLAPKRNELKFLQEVIVVGEGVANTCSWEELLAEQDSDLETAVTSKDEMAFWLYSSGTTGKPKAVIHLHHDLLCFIPPYWHGVLKINEEDVVFSTSKLYFSYGRNNSLDATFLLGASVVLFPEKPEPEKLVEVIEKYRPTVYFSVPSSYAALLQYLEKNDVSPDFGSIRCCVSAGEALPLPLQERWQKNFGMGINDGVGSTDVGGVYVGNRPEKIKPGASGKLLPGFEGRLLDPDGNEVATGEIGTLFLKNDGITSGYWNKHAKTKEVLNGEWFKTGDQFYRDEEGYFWYAGREDDMLKAGGIWVSPLEVENIILEHQAVFECAVIGAPDSRGLEKPLAFVVLEDGYSPSPELEVELQEYVRSRTAHYKYPRWIHFVDDLPRTASGKIQRYKLKAGNLPGEK